MAIKIRKNDKIIVLSGKEKGKTGVVQSVIDSKKVIIKGLNLVTKHQKSNPSRNLDGGIFQKEACISISNIAILNVSTGKSDRIGFRFEDGKKVRFLKSNKKTIK